MSQSNVASSLRQQLLATFQDPKYRPPPLPSVTFELLKLSQREDADVGSIVRVLERDEMLAALVLRLVSSTVYAGRVSVRTLREAVIRLGIRTVRNVVIEAALRKSVFNLPEYNEAIERVGRHSIVTAYLARLICHYTRVNEEHAFLGGLLHDIGFAAILFSLTRKKEPAPPPLNEIWQEVDAMHESASRVVTKLWGLPQDISVLVGHHHQLHTGNTSHIAAVINIADALSARFDASITLGYDAEGNPLPADQVTLVEYNDSVTVLNLHERTIEKIIKDAGPIIDQVLGR